MSEFPSLLIVLLGMLEVKASGLVGLRRPGAKSGEEDAQEMPIARVAQSLGNKFHRGDSDFGAPRRFAPPLN